MSYKKPNISKKLKYSFIINLINMKEMKKNKKEEKISISSFFYYNFAILYNYLVSQLLELNFCFYFY